MTQVILFFRLYVSHVISYLIGYSGRVFHYIPSLEYARIGEMSDCGKICSEIMRCILSIWIIFFDSTGTLSRQNREKLSVLQSRGASYIGYTVEDEAYKISALKVLQDADCIL